MAQKAAKQTAHRNAAQLTRTHRITVFIHVSYLLSRLLRRSLARKPLLLYVLLSSPALAVEFWLERIGRPRYGVGAGPGAATAGATELRKTGEDLEAKGVMEVLWDVVYWTWGCLALVTFFGDWAWWLWAAVPLYSLYRAYGALGGMRQGLGLGLVGKEEQAPNGEPASSKRQKKVEKRGQRVQYR
ncbi:MAG: hypothetical protein M1826_003213 [Phylliscum demangeonii]|nr:MAG: hypothetical protein M1826_003213 [Phylliscum demangeonii]